MHALDNPIWFALTSRQSHLGTANEMAGRFFPDVSLLAGLAQPTSESYEALADLVRPGERVGLFLDTAPVSAPWLTESSVPLQQMLHGREQFSAPKDLFVRLSDADVPEMVALTQLARPGPFAKRTHEMGEYWGIRQDGRLVAMAGERLQVPGLTEISAVCTHPDYLGRGHARALITMLLNRICGRGEQAFLHVRPENERAVRLYEQLGFARRALFQYVILERKEKRPR